MKLKTIFLLSSLVTTLILSSSVWAEPLVMQRISAHSEQTLLLAMGNPCNPCASNNFNPCAAAASNPCSTNPCNPCNPCATVSNQTNTSDQIDPQKIKRPSWFNGLYNKDSRAHLVAYGEQLFNDTRLGSNGTKCADCHAGSNLFNASFLKPYPHKVSMAKQRAGLNTVHADEFVQFCINVPLAGESLPWKSKKLAALTAYILDVAQPAYIEKIQGAAMAIDNPCAGKASNPCTANSGNPCAGKVLSSILEQTTDNSNVLTPASFR